MIVDGNHRYIAARILGREVKVVPSVLPNSLRDKKSSISKIEVDSEDWGNH